MHPLDRELAWDFLRTNYRKLLAVYGKDDFRLGQLLLDISETFEDEYMFFEVRKKQLKNLKILAFLFSKAIGVSLFHNRCRRNN